MLNSYSLSNFKGIKHLKGFKLNPLTILCGINSIGKSSFLQSILLLKQSHSKSEDNKPLILNGEYVQLGTPNNIIYDHEEKNILGFEIDFEYYYDPNKHKFNISYIDDPGSFEQMKDTIRLSYKVVNSQFALESLQMFPTYDTGSPILDIKLLEQNIYTLVFEEQHPYFVKLLSYNGLLPEFKFLHDIVHHTPMETATASEFILKYLKDVNQSLNELMNSINYIGPFREPPLRRYNSSETYTQVGVRGQNAPIIYAQEYNRVLLNCYTFDPEADNFIRNPEIKLAAAVRFWMDLMGFHDLKLDFYEELISMTVKTRETNSSRANIADIGFGFSQLFPIILQGLRMAESGVILLEQPEIHLHPLLQMKLGDFLLSLALSGKQVIVETHSEHIINRLVRRIVEDETDKLNKISGIHFFSQGENGLEIKEVSVNDILGITNWPEGFFDQSVDEKERILLSSLKKRQAGRGNIR